LSATVLREADVVVGQLETPCTAKGIVWQIALSLKETAEKVPPFVRCDKEY